MALNPPKSAKRLRGALNCQKMALRVPIQKNGDHFFMPISPPRTRSFQAFGTFRWVLSQLWNFAFFCRFSPSKSTRVPKNLPPWEGKVLERKRKQFWNQWTKRNNLEVCPRWKKIKNPIRITLPSTTQHRDRAWRVPNEIVCSTK